MQRRTAKVVIDYQNIHLTGHGKFVPDGVLRHESLVHPLHFANQWLTVRNRTLAAKGMAGGVEQVQYDLVSVAAFRGLPSNKENPNGYRRNQAQQSEWTRDERVAVTYRPLRYSGQPGNRVIQEKGVDVMVALELVRSADRHTADVVVLASHDTDMEPALATALEADNVTIETVGWDRCRVLRVPGVRLWHTRLYGEQFVNSRDRKDYT